MALGGVGGAVADGSAGLWGWGTGRGRGLGGLGDPGAGDTLGRQAVSLAEQTDSTDLRANALLHLAEVVRLSGRPDEAQPFERRAFRLLDRTGASAQAAAGFRNLRPESGLPSPDEDGGPDGVPAEEPQIAAVVDEHAEPSDEAG